MKTVIKVQDLSKIYRLYGRPADQLKEVINPFGKKYHQDFYALSGINLEVAQGEILGIVGKNGSGKSTLLKMITGISTPTSGKVEVDGKISALIELGAGFNPEYTGIENIYLNGSILGYSKKNIDQKMDEILSFADIGNYVCQPVKTYSSGMLVRLAFAVAITVDPDILIIDEALAVGDVLFQRKCFSRINSFIENGKTVLFVSHSLDTVNQMCTRAILMDSGEIILNAKPSLVRSSYFRLLYSTGEEALNIREEIKNIDRDPECKKTLETDVALNTGVDSESLEGITEKGANQRDVYLPDLMSQSLVETKISDVDIYDFCMTNLKGEKVNFISTGEHYIFSHKIRFNVAAEKVTTRLMFKMVNGFPISTAEAPGQYPFDYIEEVKTGEEILVKWDFKCNLLTGTYYTNLAVWGSVGRMERDCLSRIVDALVFKVQDIPNSKYVGLVHQEQQAEIKRL